MASDVMMRGGAKPATLNLAQRLMIEAPWSAITMMLRLATGFRIEGAEFLPSRGPFILVHNELSPMGFLMTGWLDIQIMKQNLQGSRDSITFLHQERMSLPFFRSVLNEKTPGKYAALTPLSAGRLALGLLEAYHVLQNGGVVLLYPEGDMPWDGRPLPLGHALAWLALHSGAPIVPALSTIGAYDMWPRWQWRMNLTGRMRLVIGKPLRLCDQPLAHVADDDIAAAERHMRAYFEEMCFGPGGVGEWAGIPKRNGKPSERPPHLPPVDRLTGFDGKNLQNAPPSKRGIAFLLWRCPICHTNESLFHVKHWVNGQRLDCLACGTRWRVRRVAGRDFQLQVVEGPAELVGLEMALSAWYDEVRRDFTPEPIRTPTTVQAFQSGEQVFLEGNKISLELRRPNPLFENWAGREPPRAITESKSELGDWERVDKGELVLTSERLIWQGGRGELDLSWRGVTSIVLWLFDNLTVHYGAMPYRFVLGMENGLKWLAHARLQAQRAAEQTGQKLIISPF